MSNANNCFKLCYNLSCLPGQQILNLKSAIFCIFFDLEMSSYASNEVKLCFGDKEEEIKLANKLNKKTKDPAKIRIFSFL